MTFKKDTYFHDRCVLIFQETCLKFVQNKNIFVKKN